MKHLPAFSLTTALLLFCGSTLAQDAISPQQKLDFLADPDMAYFHVHLNKEASLSTDATEIWKITDEGHLNVSGEGMGYLRSNQAYKDYHLVIEFQYGERTLATREDRARDCGLLIHGYGPDGAYGNTWLSSIEAQIIEGGSGDILALAAKGEDGTIAPTQVTATVTEDRDGEPVWDPNGEKKTFPLKGKTMARINWKDRDPDWADVKGYRGAKDIENPLGEWNRMEVICDGDRIEIRLNGVKVNEVTNCQPSEGWIGLQSEYSECHIRRLEIYPIGGFDEKWDPEKKTTDMGYSITGESILPRKYPLSPEESAAKWEIDGDYELQLVAAEPVTCDPVDVVWDEAGRMYVAEMRDYPLPLEDGKPNLSRIRILYDDDGDGRMDRAKTWADHLDHVQGLLPMKGGLLATTRTAILFLKDTDGDDVADQKDILFISNDPRHSQLQVSCPRWGLDNAIYLNNGLDGKEIYPEGHEDEKVEFTKLNLRYDPYSKTLEPLSGGGQFGGSLDGFGRRFFCSNRNPVMFAVMPLEAVKRNPLAGILVGHEDIQEPGAPVWPISLSHTTSAAHAGTHTAACGLGVYRGDLTPDLRENIFVCDPTAQLVTRNKLVRNGASFNAERVGNKRDFLVSGDEWTRPVNVRNGPDGALYVCDMYRRFIDHARFFPEEFSKVHYMRAGVDQGRIWRLVPKGGKSSGITALPDDVAGLAEELKSPKGWRRTHAQRLLVEKGDKAAIDPVRRVLHDPDFTSVIAHALWTLQALGDLNAADVKKVLEFSTEPSLHLVKRHFSDDPGLMKAIAGMVNSDKPRAQFLSVAMFPDAGDRATGDLVKMVAKDPSDPWMRRAVMSSYGDRTGEIVASLLADSSFTGKASDAKTELLKDMSTLVAANGDALSLALVIRKLQGEPAWWHFAVVNGFSDGLRKSQLKQKTIAALVASPPAEIGDSAEVLKGILEDAEALALDPDHPVADRIAALPIVAQQGMEKTLPVVEKLIEPSVPASLQAAACQSMSRFKREEVANFFFQRWDTLPPTPMREALALITGNTNTGLMLMKKMKAGEINKGIMPAMTRWSYGRSTNEEIKELATELFGHASEDRAKVITDYRSGISGREGDPEKGKAVFAKAACITCHKLGDVGVEVGPPLADVRIKPAEALLTDILDPNRAVEERWVSNTVETKEGTILSGLVAADDDTGITLKVPGGITQVVPRGEIKKVTSTGISLMPVGLEAAISKEDMADLIAFLKSR